MFSCKVNDKIELRLIEPQHAGELFKVLDLNRDHLPLWHPWVDTVRSASDAQATIVGWHQLCAANRGIFAGIWFNGNFAGMINHQNVDWPNRWSALSYWLDAAHQGQGIMTTSCRALLYHSFERLKLNRITIECATENARSRAIPERLGFKLEGIVRGIERLQDRFVDHAMYGLLRSDWANQHTANVAGKSKPQRAEPAVASRPSEWVRS
jgi:ribosomal-protein-serine acetyltransferase